MRENTPDRNRGVYLLAYHDAFGGLLGIRGRLYPELSELKRQWDTVHQRLTDHLGQLRLLT